MIFTVRRIAYLVKIGKCRRERTRVIYWTKYVIHAEERERHYRPLAEKEAGDLLREIG